MLLYNGTHNIELIEDVSSLSSRDAAISSYFSTFPSIVLETSV